MTWYERIKVISIIAIVIIWLYIAVEIAVIIISNPLITYDSPVGLVKDLATASITVSSIVLATILGICAIIANKSEEHLPIQVSILPILGIVCGLFALYFSFFESDFSKAKSLLAVSLELTIGSFMIIFILLNSDRYFKNSKNDDDSNSKKKISIKKITGDMKLDWYNLSPKQQLFVWIVILLFVNLLYYIPIKSIIQQSYEDLIDSIYNLFILVWITLIFVYYTYQRVNEIRFIEALSDMVHEIIVNLERLSDESFEEQIKNIPKKMENGDWAGFDKWPSFTNWSSDPTNFYLKYLPTTNYFYFVSQGFFSSRFANKIDEGTKQIIAKTYFKFSRINNTIQGLENQLLRRHRNLPENYREIFYSKRNYYFSLYYTTDFMKESIAPIQKLQELYPEIKKENELYALKEKLKI
jgi:hypothetical protein